MSLQNGARLLERNVNSLSRGSQRTLKTDSMVKMKDKDLAELALSLEIMEIEMRSQLTLARVVRWLRWRRTPDAQSPTARPFSPLSDKVTLLQTPYRWYLTAVNYRSQLGWSTPACKDHWITGHRRCLNLSRWLTCVYIIELLT